MMVHNYIGVFHSHRPSMQDARYSKYNKEFLYMLEHEDLRQIERANHNKHEQAAKF